MSWLLLLAGIVLVLVFSVVGVEFLVRWVSLARVQNAAGEAAAIYAREMVRLRDTKLNDYNAKYITYAQAGLIGSNSTPIAEDSPLKNVLGNNDDLEYTIASQYLLYNLHKDRLSDPSEVQDIRQYQCYTEFENTKFNKIGSTQETCEATGNVTSPVMFLSWSIVTSPYGSGVCCSDNSEGKDFCVNITVDGRMDPIIAGGLDFLTGRGIFNDSSTNGGRQKFNPISFITDGDFNVSAVVSVADMAEVTGSGDLDSIAANLSGETVSLENKLETSTSCPLVPPLEDLIIPPENFLPGSVNYIPPTWEPPTDITEICIGECINSLPDTSNISSEVPSCEAGYEVTAIYNPGKQTLEFVCTPCSNQGEVQEVRCEGDTIVGNVADGSCGSDEQELTQCQYGCYNGSCADPPPDPEDPNGASPPTQGGNDVTKNNTPSGGNNNKPKGCEYLVQKNSPFTESQNYSDIEFANSLADQCVKGDETGVIDCIFDNKGNLISTTVYEQYDSNNFPDNFCGAVFISTPISLVFGDNPESLTNHSIVNFPLNPEFVNNKFFHWKASRDLPLLVYDPDKTGIIKDGTQLFGNYTFGKEWPNGYEALKSLDSNNDSKLSEEELKDISLWFDKNNDGISQSGEVKTLGDVGIISIFFKPSYSDIITGDIHASIGYERIVNGKVIQGSSVDWYGAGPFNTIEEAINDKVYPIGFGSIATKKYYVGRN